MFKMSTTSINLVIKSCYQEWIINSLVRVKIHFKHAQTRNMIYNFCSKPKINVTGKQFSTNQLRRRSNLL